MFRATRQHNLVLFSSLIFGSHSNTWECNWAPQVVSVGLLLHEGTSKWGAIFPFRQTKAGQSPMRWRAGWHGDRAQEDARWAKNYSWGVLPAGCVADRAPFLPGADPFNLRRLLFKSTSKISVESQLRT